MQKQRLRIAIQKKGRLHNDCMDLLKRCGLKLHINNNALFYHCENLPIDILFVRDDDIPTLVNDNICDLGIIGENVLIEYGLSQQALGNQENYDVVNKLGFSICRLSIAVPKDQNISNIKELKNKRIATSYPNLLQAFLVNNNLDAKILTISGSVEIAPRLNMADCICDLVSTGRTLEENNLNELISVLQSQAVLIKNKEELSYDKQQVYDLLTRRIEGATQAQESKYIMFHAPKSALAEIKAILPGFEAPTIMQLEGCDDKVAVHLVSREAMFWSTLEKLKKAGASSILVLPIEKMLM